ncbi:MAG: penicillin-binding protein 2, partial [Holophagales bacterium]|nr:penicillin-binding protein 2 [Holophagales bacterium]
MSPPVPLHRPSFWQHGRLVLLTSLAAVWLGALLFRLFWLQVEEHDQYVGRAEEQQQRVVELDPPRGTIFDAEGRPLAVSVEVSSIAAHPGSIEDPPAVARLVAETLGLDPGTVRAALESNRRFVWIERKVDRPKAEALRAKVQELGIRGIDFLPESKRYYPMRELLAQVLGYVGLDNSGLAGLEYRYERVVAAEKGRRTVLLDGRAGAVTFPNLDLAEARPGDDLHLTIDAAVQHITERELEKAVRESGADSGMAMMLDPRTGAVRAMASYPTFDPNHFGAFPKERWRNAPVMDAYEPGSTFKMVTLAAALEANAIDSLATFHCGNGHIVLGRTLIRDNASFGELSVREIIANSSNVGAIKLGQVAGRHRLFDTIEGFGFGDPTGVDLPSENAGLL